MKKTLFLAMFLFSFDSVLAQDKSLSKAEDPANKKQEETAHTSPRGEKLSGEMGPCKDASCDKFSLSSSGRNDDNCNLGSNIFNKELCGRGAGKTKSADGGQGEDGNQ
ncbi:MAG: hypothetical protein RJB66_2206 [Pseudomonadota bacterium]|jgi:hypothetical protein